MRDSTSDIAGFADVVDFTDTDFTAIGDAVDSETKRFWSDTPLKTLLSGDGNVAAVKEYCLPQGIGSLWAAGGISALYGSLPQLLLRELPFQVTKLLTYDAVTQGVANSFPSLQESSASAALLSLLSGCIAGVAAAVVSNPADVMLTKSQSGNGLSRPNPPLTTLVAILRSNPCALFSGLVPRCVFFGALIAGQFLLYDIFKKLFGVGSDDLELVLDVFADRLSFYDSSGGGTGG